MNTTQVPYWTLADRLRKAREHAQLEQDQLARLLGIHRNSVGNYERGLRVPSADVVEAWSEATNVDADWIREGETERSEADDLVDQIARLVASRARRDSNPQPSDPESDDLLVCPFCPYETPYIGYLERHIERVHIGARREDLAVAA